MAINWGESTDLAPFISLVVLRRDGDTSVESAASEVRGLLKVKGGDRRKRFSKVEALPESSCTASCRFHYVEERPPGWLVRETATTPPPSTSIRDRRHHIALLLAHEESRFVALHLSEGEAADLILKAAKAGTLKLLSSVAPKDLEERLARGPARTLWMGTVQRKSSHRADAKVLSGDDLTFALNPLEDQGYSFSSVRCDHSDTPKKRDVVGVSPGKARVWTGPAADLDAFTKKTKSLLEVIDSAPVPPAADSFRQILAGRAPTRPIKRAFELTVVHPDLDESSRRESDEVVARRRRWAEEKEVAITAVGTGTVFKATVPGLPAACALEGHLEDDDLKLTCTAGHTGADGPCAEAREVLGTPEWVILRYGSGHTWTGGELYEMRLRPARFEPVFITVKSDVNLREEKPRIAQTDENGKKKTKKDGTPKLSNTLAPGKLLGDHPSDGEKQRSLFNWIWWDRPAEIAGGGGWLACDDGAGERADFIYVEGKVVRLIHVKACHSTGKGVSLLDFEQVVAQAIKNLRWLDIVELSVLMKSPSDNVKDLVRPPLGVALPTDKMPRDTFADILEALGDNYERQVVVVQPALRQSNWGNAKSDSKELLSTLLTSARATCQGLNATFEVVCRQ